MKIKVFAYDTNDPDEKPEICRKVADLSRPYYSYARVDCIDVSTGEVVAAYTKGYPAIWSDESDKTLKWSERGYS